MTWHTPLRYASLHDRARARAEALRAKADEIDAKADEYERKYDELMRPINQRMKEHIAHLKFQKEDSAVF